MKTLTFPGGFLGARRPCRPNNLTNFGFDLSAASGAAPFDGYRMRGGSPPGGGSWGRSPLQLGAAAPTEAPPPHDGLGPAYIHPHRPFFFCWSRPWSSRQDLGRENGRSGGWWIKCPALVGKVFYPPPPLRPFFRPGSCLEPPGAAPKPPGGGGGYISDPYDCLGLRLRPPG